MPGPPANQHTECADYIANRHTACACYIAVACFALLLATAPMLPMAWDEGDAILRAEGIPHGQWQYTTAVEGHPAFYGMLIAAGQWLGAAWLAPLTAARLGPILLFSLAAGVLYFHTARDYSATAAIAAILAILLLPRLFAHLHFASYDGPLASCWLLTYSLFLIGQRSSLNFLLFGLALGLTLSCKATGWLAPLPFLAWALLYRDRAALKTLACGIPMALATFFVLNPPLWHDPLGGWITFFDLNLHRSAQPGLNIATQFFGRLYNLDHPLPWHNTLVWTAITVPLGILVLFVLGLGTACRRWREQPQGVLLALNWLTLVVVRALPGTPPHDAERLFLPSFAFLAVLAGVGAAALAATRRRAIVAAILLLSSGTSLVWYAPQWLSYYSLLIGGLPGATALGMEPTYYWDALDSSALDWLHAHTRPDEKICFAAGSTENLDLFERWQTLRRATDADAPGAFRWYVLQCRPSAWQPADLWLRQHVQPAYVKTLRSGGVGPWRLDVPLVEVYSYDDFLTARHATEGKRP